MVLFKSLCHSVAFFAQRQLRVVPKEVEVVNSTEFMSVKLAKRFVLVLFYTKWCRSICLIKSNGCVT